MNGNETPENDTNTLQEAVEVATKSRVRQILLGAVTAMGFLLTGVVLAKLLSPSDEPYVLYEEFDETPETEEKTEGDN